MGLVEVLERIKEKIARIFGMCESQEQELQKALELASEIEQMIDEWLQKVESGVAKTARKKTGGRKK